MITGMAPPPRRRRRYTATNRLIALAALVIAVLALWRSRQPLQARGGSGGWTAADSAAVDAFAGTHYGRTCPPCPEVKR